MLKIENLCVSLEGKQILKGLNLEVLPGQIHAIMGPNGAGKSTLGKVLSGDPSYDEIDGQVLFEGETILELSPEERSHLGIFLSFQYPLEIPGISNKAFLEAALSAQRKAHKLPPYTKEEFESLLEECMKQLDMKETFKDRNLNEGFSGGEKKKNEILQMALLNPKLTILDETDSGLDIDAMRVIAKGVNQFHSKEKGLIIITHYQRLLEYIKPDFVHVLIDGKIAMTGGMELAEELEARGYDWIEKESAACKS